MFANLTRLLPQRLELLDTLKQKSSCEVLVVGGGIHGAAFAHLATLNGLDTVLLEREDYGFGTSSRSSKMAHGGLRYLEHLDFSQVFQGIKARNELLKTAAHLVTPTKFFAPIYKGELLRAIKIRLGLTLYDLMQAGGDFKSAWIPARKVQNHITAGSKPDLLGGYQYFDGLMNDVRLVLENVMAAREEGALCLNHCSLEHVGQIESGRVRAFWLDRLTKVSGEIEAGIVVNCSGPWVPFVGKYKNLNLAERVRYSQGAHLIFNKPWPEPALLFPMEQRGRYYFVWPHFAGTLVGTTERTLDSLEDDPLPTFAEVDEILTRLSKDLPNSGLNRSTLAYAFAGVRTMALRKRKSERSPSSISRRHLWSYHRGVLSLLGGKFTTAHWTAEEGLKLVLKLAEIERELIPVRTRVLSGAVNLAQISSEFKARVKTRELSERVAERALKRLGAKVNHFYSDAEDEDLCLEVLADQLFRGEVELALAVEQAETLEDLMRRRLELEYQPDNGLAVLPKILEILKLRRPSVDFSEQRQNYLARIERTKAIFR